MSNKGQVLSINFGDFAVSLEGFDDPFTVMKQVTDYLEARKSNDPDFGSKSLEAETGLSEQMSEALPLDGAEVELSNDMLKLTASDEHSVSELMASAKKSPVEAEKITQNIQMALKEAIKEPQLEPLPLQDPVTDEEMAEVEMTFATDRHQVKKATQPIDLEEHAEETKELPFVGRSGNQNRKPARSKIKIIRNDYSSLLEEAEQELKERQLAEAEKTAEAPLPLEKTEAVEEPKPAAKKFRKLKPAAEEPKVPETEPQVEEKPKPAANVPYRKLKAN